MEGYSKDEHSGAQQKHEAPIFIVYNRNIIQNNYENARA